MAATHNRKLKRLPIAGVAICLLVMISLGLDAVIDARDWPIVQANSTESSQAMTTPNLRDQIAADHQEAVASNTSSLIPIHLVGAIKQPGIYQITVGTYLYELLEMAGGMTDDAAAEQINLALRLDVNQQIYIPTREEALHHPALLPSTPDQTPDHLPLLELNTATAAEFEQLPGVGPVTAQAIIAYREEHGGFSCSEDLMLVPGIKESRFAALQDLIYVRSADH